MAEATATKLLTAEDLLAMPEGPERRELVEGRLVTMTPAGAEHGSIEMEVMGFLAVWAKQHRVGRAYSSDTGFILSRDPDTVRCPDGALILKDRLPAKQPKGFLDIIPDLVLEVVSPSDAEPAVLEKIGVWLEAGVKVVWVVWPETRRVQVWRAADDVTTLREDETLACEDLLPGFSLPLADLFA